MIKKKTIPACFLLFLMLADAIRAQDRERKGMIQIVKNRKGQFARVGNDKYTASYHVDTPFDKELPIQAVKVADANRFT
jgi:hypothetical protein